MANTNTPSNGRDGSFVETGALEYRSISSWAVLAFVLAAVSPVLFVAPLLIVIPLASCFAAVVAFAKVRSSPETVTGATLARWAVALAIVCMVAAPTRTALRDWLLLREADATARQWLSVLSEARIEEAAGYLDARGIDKLFGPNTTDTPQPPPSLEQVFATLHTTELTTSLVAMNSGAELNIVSLESGIDGTSRQWHTRLDYAVNKLSKNDNFAKPLQVSVTMQKWKSADVRGRGWLITDWQTASPDSTGQAP